MKIQTRILDNRLSSSSSSSCRAASTDIPDPLSPLLPNRLYYTRKIELQRKGKMSRTVRITPIVICSSVSEISVLITVRSVHYSKMGKVPTTPPPHPTPPQVFYFVKVLLIFFSFWVDHQWVGEFFLPDRRISGVCWGGSKSNMSKIVSIGSSPVCGSGVSYVCICAKTLFRCSLCSSFVLQYHPDKRK